MRSKVVASVVVLLVLILLLWWAGARDADAQGAPPPAPVVASH